MLLPSGPDMVHGFPLRRTQTSTLRARGRPYNTCSLEKEFSLARADCKLQDTATFPPSTAFSSIPFFQPKSKRLFANRTAKGSICRISAYFAEIKARYEQLWLMTPSL